ncbi:hypothetical protein D9M73_119600 [compost metagenome]
MAVPSGCPVTVQHRRVARARGGEGAGNCQRFEGQIIKRDLARAAVAPAHQNDLHGGCVPQASVAAWAPGKAEVARAQHQRLPGRGWAEVSALIPPDIGTARVGELELQVVDTTGATHLQPDRIIGWPVDRQSAARKGVARDIMKIIAQPQAVAGCARHRIDFGTDAVRGVGLPRLDRFEGIEWRNLRRAGQQQCRQHHANQPPENPARVRPRRRWGLPHIVRQIRPERRFSIIATIGPWSMPR